MQVCSAAKLFWHKPSKNPTTLQNVRHLLASKAAWRSLQLWQFKTIQKNTSKSRIVCRTFCSCLLK